MFVYALLYDNKWLLQYKLDILVFIEVLSEIVDAKDRIMFVSFIVDIELENS